MKNMLKTLALGAVVFLAVSTADAAVKVSFNIGTGSTARIVRYHTPYYGAVRYYPTYTTYPVYTSYPTYGYYGYHKLSPHYSRSRHYKSYRSRRYYSRRYRR